MSVGPKAARRLRVLQCITRLGLGGAERVAFAIMRGLRTEIDFGVFTVHGGSADDVGEEMRRELMATNIPWFTGTAVPMKCGGMVPGGMALAGAIRDFQPDVLHFHSETPEACGAMNVRLSAADARTPVVRTIHNSIFWRYWPRVGRWCDRQLAHAYIACVSSAARDEFQRYRHDSGARPPPAEPVIIYNGVSTIVREPHGEPRRANVRRVIFAGRFEDQKGTDVLSRALPLVRLPGHARGELSIIGHGAHRSQVRTLAHRPPAGWTVTVLPPVSDLARYFSECDLVVVPSRFEGLGLVAIEATLSGVPVVTTDAPGLRETLPPEYPWRALPGDVTTLANSLTAALEETSRWRDVVCAAQEFARSRFSPAVMAADYQRLYTLAAGASPQTT